MLDFVKKYPEVLMLYTSFITTCLMAFVGYYIKSTMERIKEELKTIHIMNHEHDCRIIKLECKL